MAEKHHNVYEWLVSIGDNPQLLLRALRTIDRNHDRNISDTELARYAHTHWNSMAAPGEVASEATPEAWRQSVCPALGTQDGPLAALTKEYHQPGLSDEAKLALVEKMHGLKEALLTEAQLKAAVQFTNKIIGDSLHKYQDAVIAWDDLPDSVRNLLPPLRTMKSLSPYSLGELTPEAVCGLPPKAAQRSPE